MKKLFLLLLVLFFTAISMFAQKGFNYKAIIFDNGNVIQNQNIDLRFTILEDGSVAVYQETHSTVTNDAGIIIVNIGEGTILSGDFGLINWANNQFLKVEIDLGSGYNEMSNIELKYVPVAKYAEKAGNIFSGNFNDLTNVPSYDGSTTNELQTLSVSGNELTISDGNMVALPENTYYAGAGIQINPGNVISNTGDADADATNELQTLSISGNELSISAGNSVTLPSSSGSDVDFLEVGTDQTPDNIIDNIYHTGNISVEAFYHPKCQIRY